MYRINQLPRKVLITPDEVIALGPTEHSVDPRNILLSIQNAEDRFIRQALGKDLYNDFRNKKNVLVTDVNKDFLKSFFPTDAVIQVGQMVNAIELVDNQNYVDLWNEHLWKLIAECVVYIATPTNYIKSTAEGEMVTNPKSIGMTGEGSASVDLKDIKWKMDKAMMDRIDPSLAPMEEYICDNISSFPLYDSKKCNCADNNGVSYKRKTGWVHVYKDTDCRSCNDD